MKRIQTPKWKTRALEISFKESWRPNCMGLITTSGVPLYLALWQNCEKRLLASSCLRVCLSVRMEQLGSQWTNFHQI